MNNNNSAYEHNANNSEIKSIENLTKCKNIAHLFQFKILGLKKLLKNRLNSKKLN